MNKTLTVALSMCAGVAIVGAGVFAQSGGITADSTVGSVSAKARQGITKQFEKFRGNGQRAKSETITAAIEANNYLLLSTDEQAKITTDQFAKMVSMNTARTAHQTAIETAVKNNDFAAFQAEQTSFQTTMEANKPANNDKGKQRGDRPTASVEDQQARFDKMVAYYNTNGTLPQGGDKGKGGHGRGGDHDRGRGGKMKSETIIAAVEANNYSLLSTDEQAKITSEQFAKMVSMKSTMESGKVAIEAAIKANDFAAFKTAVIAKDSAMESMKPSDVNDDRPTPTDTQLQAQFDKAVEYYTANGSLPEAKMMGKGMKGQKEGMNKGSRGANNKTPGNGLISTSN